MEDFFIGLYSILHGVQPPDWDDVYMTTGIILIGFSFLSAVIYYYVLNKFFLHWFKMRRWFLIMLINTLLIGLFAYCIAINILQTSWLDGTVLSFGFINLLYGAIMYFIASCMICWGSPRAKYTPLRFLVK
jgi:uncharacterized BrkB/YihY/UPF0761 family membrane protein